MQTTTSSPASYDLEARWRPNDTSGPVCGYTFRGTACPKSGAHYCAPRADRVVTFFARMLVHVKGPLVRTPFILLDWQEFEIVRPLFGEVQWSAEWGCYARRYRIAYIVVARKNGKALDVDTPIWTARGWMTMGELVPGDTVYALDGTPTTVRWVSDRHIRLSYRVESKSGKTLIAADDHKWTVHDQSKRGTPLAVRTTEEMLASFTFSSRRDRRWALPATGAVKTPAVSLPIDPYVLGAWLGDGTASRAEITSPDPEIIAAVEAAGYPASYDYDAGKARTRGFLGLVRPLTDLGVLRNKHVPDAYLNAGTEQRLALLRGLMDTDGSAVRTGRSGTTVVEYTSVNKGLALAVLQLARSLGWKPTFGTGRAMLNGRDCGEKYRVAWTADRDRSPFRLARKSERLPLREGARRSDKDAVVAIEPVGEREVVCIEVDHPSHTFLAGEDFMPTHNSEIAAAIQLYMLVGDDEESSEVYCAAKDTKQAGKVFEPALRMTQLSPALSRRLVHNKNARRLIDEKSGSHYEILTADAEGELGHNPHAFNLDEVLSQPDGSMWEAMTTAAGARLQELLYATTTETDDDSSFGADLIDEAEKTQDDPARAPHVFSFVRKLPHSQDELDRLHETFPGHPHLPVSLDPFDEANWKWPNPALDQFKSRDAMRRQALDAKNDPAKENGFRQFQTNQRVQQKFRWMPMHLYRASGGDANDIWLKPDYHRDRLKGRPAWAGFDLAARSDLTAWCTLIPEGKYVHALWRFWLPEAALRELDKKNDGKFSRWVKAGWIVATPGPVVDYERVYGDVGEDAAHFDLLAADCDVWSSAPVIQRIENDTQLWEIEAYKNDFSSMTLGMDELMALVKTDRLLHHGNPVAEFCFDSVEVRKAPYNPDLIRPDKPERGKVGKRIDGVVAMAMACNAMLREPLDDAVPTEQPKIVISSRGRSA
jgi:phage terminase large subunit-like protein